jgi:hypothetical protein
MSFGEKRPQRDQRGSWTAAGSQELCWKSPAVIGHWEAGGGQNEISRAGERPISLSTRIRCNGIMAGRAQAWKAVDGDGSWPVHMRTQT